MTALGRPHHDAFRARLLIAGGSLGDGPVHSIDRAPTSWLALAGGLHRARRARRRRGLCAVTPHSD